MLPLGSAHVVRDPRDEDLAGVVDAHQRARARSVERWRELVAGPARIDVGQPNVDVIETALSRAVRTASEDVAVHVPTAPDEVTVVKASPRRAPHGDHETLDHDGVALGNATRDGGLSLLHAERHLDIPDLAEDLARALSAPVVTTAVWGTARASTVRCGNLSVVFGIGADVLVRSTDGRQEVSVPPGSSAPFEQFGDLLVGSGGVALVVAANRATRHDLRSIAALKATGAPALRGDVPVDARAPAVRYGSDVETTAIDHLNSSLLEVYGGPGADREAAAWWRAGLRSVRPPVDAVNWARVRDLESVRICGTLVGGVGVVSHEDHRLLAFGGLLVRLEDHLISLLELAANATPFALDQVDSSCPHDDPNCVRNAARSLVELGAAYVA